MGFYTESARQMINPMDVPTFMIECAQTERELFEGLIELDFAQVYKENGLAVFTEEETEAADKAGKEASGNVIATIIKKAQEALSNAFKKVEEKIKELQDKSIEFFTKKVLENPKAKECDKSVLWWEDYKKAAEAALNPKQIPNELNRIAINAGKDKDEQLNKISQFFDDFNSKLAGIPTSTAEAESADNKSDVKATPVKDHDIMSLRKALSDATAYDELKKIYEELKKVDTSQFDIKEGDSDELIANKTKSARQVWKLKLGYFMAAGKVYLTIVKIAYEDLTAIRTYIKGGSKEEVQQNSAIYSAISDLLYESIVEF